jgi:hypothetical protein
MKATKKATKGTATTDEVLDPTSLQTAELRRARKVLDEVCGEHEKVLSALVSLYHIAQMSRFEGEKRREWRGCRWCKY